MGLVGFVWDGGASLEERREGGACEREASERVGWRKTRSGGQAGEQDSDIHALRRGDTDKVCSLPFGQAVITVGPRFQVATLSCAGIIGSRLGATSQPSARAGGAIVWQGSVALRYQTLTRAHSGSLICPGNHPSNHLSCYAMLCDRWACLNTSELMGQNGGTQKDKGAHKWKSVTNRGEERWASEGQSGADVVQDLSFTVWR